MCQYSFLLVSTLGRNSAVCLVCALHLVILQTILLFFLYLDRRKKSWTMKRQTALFQCCLSYDFVYVYIHNFEMAWGEKIICQKTNLHKDISERKKQFINLPTILPCLFHETLNLCQSFYEDNTEKHFQNESGLTRLLQLFQKQCHFSIWLCTNPYTR